MPDPDLSHTPPHCATHRLLRGARMGLPIFLGYVAVGAAFGMLAATAGFSLAQAAACSALVLAGAGQFVALSLMRSGADIAAILIATGAINLRYVLFGAAISPYLRETPLPMQASLAFSLTDETFAVNIADHQAGTADELSMTGVGAISWAGWVAGTILGVLVGGLVGDPARFGAGFAMPAMFTALLVGQVADKRHLAIGVLAGALALACAYLLPGTWFIVVASMTAATVGAVVFR